jgi:hypothetical protein
VICGTVSCIPAKNGGSRLLIGWFVPRDQEFGKPACWLPDLYHVTRGSHLIGCQYMGGDWGLGVAANSTTRWQTCTGVPQMVMSVWNGHYVRHPLWGDFRTIYFDPACPPNQGAT